MKSVSAANNFKAVTPHDTNALVNGAGQLITTRWIVVTVAGLVSCRNAEGTTVAVPCAAGVPMPIETDLIVTASTATGIVVLW